MQVLVPIDSSGYSVNSLAFVASRTTLLGIRPNIELFTVNSGLSKRKRVEDETTFSPHEKRIFEQAREFFKDDYDSIKKVVSGGSPAEAIVAEANRINAEFIIMGARGQGVLKSSLFGSVTQKVLTLTTRPVLILRNRKILPHSVMNVGVCVDGSSFGETIAKTVVAHIKQFGEFVKFDVISAVEIPDLPQHSRITPEKLSALAKEAYDKNLKKVRPVFDAAGITFNEGILSAGNNPGEAIAQYAHDHKLDLLVMGTHGYSRLKSIFMGSTALRVSSEGDIPIVIIQAEEYPND